MKRVILVDGAAFNRSGGVAQKALVAPGDAEQTFGQLSNGMMGDGG